MDHKIRQKHIADKSVAISCVVPVYNECDVIINFLNKLEEKLQTLTNNYEIVLVDDGSKDNSMSLIRNNVQSTHLKVLRFSRNFGKELALTAGIEHCNGDVAILIDCDFQHPLELIPVFINRWGEGYDMAYGVRRDRNDETRIKRAFTKLFYFLMSKLTKTNIPKNAGDFRLLDRKVIDSLKQMNERVRFMKGLYAWVGFNSIAVPYDARNRRAGESHWHFKQLWDLAMTGIISFSDIPLRAWGYIGLFITSISFVYAIFITIHTMIYGIDVPGYPSILIAVIFFGGLQLLSIGILGEYIGRIFNEVKNRPKYIIAEKIGFDTTTE